MRAFSLLSRAIAIALWLALPTAGFLLPGSTLGGHDDTPATYTLDQLQTRATTEDLLRRAKAMIDDHESRIDDAKEQDDEDTEDDLKDTLEVLEFAEKQLKHALSTGTSSRERFEINSHADRMLHTVAIPVVGELHPGILETFSNVVFGAVFGQPLPGLSPRQQQQPLGPRRAAKESAYLYDADRDVFYTVDELAEMTPEAVSQLDISPDHPVWYDWNSFQANRSHAIDRLETFLTEGLSDVLRTDDDLKEHETYDFRTSRKVLFMDYIYNAATAPKAQGEDAFGVTYKLKWGPEASIEPVSCRLYLLAGARMTDYTLTNGHGRNDMVLVLCDPKDAEDNSPDQAFPATAEDLRQSMIEFYGVDLEPYILDHGPITAENVDDILANLPEGGKKKYRKDRVIGRQWVSFRESNIEVRTKGLVRRHDGSKMSDVVALNDRATRASYLFDMWIGNRDVKDDNNKAYLLKERDGNKMKVRHYREGHHDLGLSLGSLFAAGEVNGFNTGRDFVHRGLFGKIRFPQSVLYRPDAWDAATWADGKWMARYLAAISDEDIREAVGASDWPDFAQDALAYKLIDRRNGIAAIFDLATTPELQSVEPPSLTIALGTPAQIRAAEQRYELEPGSLAAELKRIGAGPGHSETVLKNGQIAEDQDSALVRTLVKQRYPSGLASRYRMLKKTLPAAFEELK